MSARVGFKQGRKEGCMTVVDIWGSPRPVCPLALYIDRASQATVMAGNSHKAQKTGWDGIQ